MHCDFCGRSIDRSQIGVSVRCYFVTLFACRKCSPRVKKIRRKHNIGVHRR